jgi:hypothetical protein
MADRLGPEEALSADRLGPEDALMADGLSRLVVRKILWGFTPGHNHRKGDIDNNSEVRYEVPVPCVTGLRALNALFECCNRFHYMALRCSHFNSSAMDALEHVAAARKRLVSARWSALRALWPQDRERFKRMADLYDLEEARFDDALSNMRGLLDHGSMPPAKYDGILRRILCDQPEIAASAGLTPGFDAPLKKAVAECKGSFADEFALAMAEPEAEFAETLRKCEAAIVVAIKQRHECAQLTRRFCDMREFLASEKYAVSTGRPVSGAAATLREEARSRAAAYLLVNHVRCTIQPDFEGDGDDDY